MNYWKFHCPSGTAFHFTFLWSQNKAHNPLLRRELPRVCPPTPKGAANRFVAINMEIPRAASKGRKGSHQGATNGTSAAGPGDGSAPKAKRVCLKRTSTTSTASHAPVVGACCSRPKVVLPRCVAYPRQADELQDVTCAPFDAGLLAGVSMPYTPDLSDLHRD